MVVEELRGAAPGSDEHRSARLLTDWLAESQSARELTSLDERQIAWEGSAAVRLPDGREIPFERAAIDMANATDRRERLVIEAARAKLVERELSPLRRERFERERDITERLGLADHYNGTFELLSGSRCPTSATRASTSWRTPRPVGRRAAGISRRRLGIKPGATRPTRSPCSSAGIRRGVPWRGDGSRREPQVREMGVDPLAAGGFDSIRRACRKALSRVLRSPVRVPDEV